ncbi:Rho-GTPase-activating protein 5 [Pleurostoma richardsiae]|uniref:Rho-GTPase-activating protein 5 n=1 Tax=Pleurostoma richardsiae TaxID=41990 RepID=A0AA38VV15_9PEZI|nr:Rho-GTPase-activating protein 5 [Pleurostoma richardsiae]
MTSAVPPNPGVPPPPTINHPGAQPATPAHIQPATPTAPSQAASPPSKRDLKSWWKGFKLPSKHQDANAESKGPGIFGVPLRQSITYANVAISLVDDNGKSYIYGYVPIVVAKCGVFLKEKATGVEGIFRLSGSEKRIKELKQIFDSPDRYGKGLSWEGYTVHDAANVLRRYLNDLPEPVVPLDLYEKFREPLKGATKQAVGDAEGPQFVDDFDLDGAIRKYQELITELPPLNRQLLLYILDLLAVFAAKADENRMTSQNLAAIFQPGMLSHPNHAMSPEEYRLNQCVLIFLIENQDHFLIGMQGTAADEKTVQEVQKGTPPVNTPVTPIPNRKSGVYRSSSNASAGAESVAREGMVRRNRSTSSRHSRQSTGGPSPASPALATTPTGGLGRSNTVPSKKSPALQSARFKRAEHSPAPPSPLTPVIVPAPASIPAPPTVEEVPTPESGNDILAAEGKTVPAAQPKLAGKSQERLLLEAQPEVATPSRERNLQSLFQRSPTGDSEKKPPNKLRKKRLPGSANPSAQSSTASLSHSAVAVSPNVEMSNPLEYISEPPRSDVSATSASFDQKSTIVEETPSEPTPRASQIPSHSTLHPASAENPLRSKKSPPTSLHSSFNEGSDIDQLEELPAPQEQPEQPEQQEKEKRRRWRLSRRKEDMAAVPNPAVTSPKKVLGSNTNADVSTSTVGSSANRPRRSFTGESSDPTLFSTEAVSSQESGSREGKDGKDDGRGLTNWIKNKYRGAKENAEQRRNKSPPADRSTQSLPVGPKSFDTNQPAEADNPPLREQPPNQQQQQEPNVSQH